MAHRRRRIIARARSSCWRRSACDAAADRPCRELAYGDVKRVELAIALANEPRLLLMDEPTAGMAPRERNALIALVKKLVVERGISVLFTEHSMDVVFAFADRIIVMARGRLIADGDAKTIRDDPLVREVYFGTRQDVRRRGRRHERRAGARVEHLNAWYGAAQILYDVAFTVGRGEVVALMGRNGAGKSTTMKAVMGLIARAPRHRALQWRGHFARSSRSRSRGSASATRPEDRRIFSDLTVMENLDAGRQPPRRFADGTPAPAWTPENLFELFPNLAELRQRPGGRMSGGEQQMLTMARTLMGNPLLVLLDEPSEGIAPLIVEQIANTIVELKKEGLSILLSEQNVHFARLVADRVYVLEKGADTLARLDGATRHQSGRAAGLFDGLRRPARGIPVFSGVGQRIGFPPGTNCAMLASGACIWLHVFLEECRRCGVKN